MVILITKDYLTSFILLPFIYPVFNFGRQVCRPTALFILLYSAYGTGTISGFARGVLVVYTTP